jgi:predicted  nucleic acid-binding Zn-ribbon protein
VTRVEAAQVASKEASTQAIADLAAKSTEYLKQIEEEIKRVEIAQSEAAKAATESVAKLTQEVSQTSKSIKELQETLKSTVTL